MIYLQESYADKDKYADLDDDHSELVKIIAAIVLFAPLWLYIVLGEIREAKQLKIEYFKRFWNWNDMLMLSLSAYVVFVCLSPGDPGDLTTLRPIAAVASCCLLAKSFDWLRLFESTAFYIQLMEQTLKDIFSFLALILTALAMFGVPMIILNLNRDETTKVVT